MIRGPAIRGLETLSSLHKLSAAISDIDPNLNVKVTEDLKDTRKASLAISNPAGEESATTAFSILGSRYGDSLQVLDSKDVKEFELTVDYSDEDVESLAHQLTEKAGFNFG